METRDAVAAIFTESGWTAGTRDGWDGQFIWRETTVVGGIDPWGTPRTTGIVDNPDEGPTDVVEAARWLVEHAKGLRLEPAPQTPVPHPIPESPPAEAPAEEVADPVGGGDEAPADGAAGSVEGADAGPAGGGLALYADDGQDGAGDSERDYAYDADYEEVGEADELEGDLGAELLLDDLSEPDALNEPEATQEPPAGGVVYFGDDIHIARLAKMGRLLEIASEKKAALQEGWTVADFASLQNLIVRIDRGEAADDVAAREQFAFISQQSRAMSGVDAYLGQREAELEAVAKLLHGSPEEREAARQAILAFDPEAGWQ